MNGLKKLIPSLEVGYKAIAAIANSFPRLQRGMEDATAEIDQVLSACRTKEEEAVGDEYAIETESLANEGDNSHASDGSNAKRESGNDEDREFQQEEAEDGITASTNNSPDISSEEAELLTMKNPAWGRTSRRRGSWRRRSIRRRSWRRRSIRRRSIRRRSIRRRSIRRRSIRRRSIRRRSIRRRSIRRRSWRRRSTRRRTTRRRSELAICCQISRPVS